MKILFILRHAKSSWDNAELSDFERPLNQRGLDAAAFMGNLMHKRQIDPDLIICSPATRASQTAILVKRAARMTQQIRYEKRIYEAGAQTLLQIISEFEDNIETALLVGHNPGLENVIKTLTVGIQSMPTAALAKINLNIESWREAPAAGQLEFLIIPKEEMKLSGAE